MTSMPALHYIGPRHIEWRETETPELQAETEALVRPLAVAACDLDFGIVAGNSPFPGPFVLGHEFVAEITTLGPGVSGFEIGDVVAVSFEPSCGSCPLCQRGHSAGCRTAKGSAMYGIGIAGGDWGGALADCVRVPYAEAMLVRLPEGISPAMAAGASDNIADGYRTVAPALAQLPGASVLIAGTGSIALYAAWWAKALGAGTVNFYSPHQSLLKRAAAFGVNAHHIHTWPRRFDTHTITVDCTGDPQGLAAVLRSTEAYGWSTCASIYFGGEVNVPMFDLNMKGIQFVTGRVNAAALLPDVIKLISKYQLTPEDVGANILSWDDMPDALLNQTFKPIAVRDTP